MPISLAPLEISAGFFQTEDFTVWTQATDTWSAGFEGRIYVFDRFKSIYHRPTRRETLGITNAVTMPTDLVIRHTATGTTYLVSGTDRIDVEYSEAYDRARSLNRTGTQGNLYRYATAGAGDNLGPLVATDLGKCWYDLELRSESPDQPDYSLQQGDMIGKYFLTSTTAMGLQEGDYIVTGDGEYLRLDVPYTDSGFALARVVHMAPTHENIVYELRTGIVGSYDPATGTVTEAVRADRTFSGYIGSLGIANQDIQGAVKYDLEVWVDVSHIGFTPVPGDYLRARSERYHIDKVTLSHSGTKYQLLCGRAAA